uniref:RadC-like JAB domain-containing protein n=1 Tax=Candidatus Kentrum eta TaxID=2126337 RepID=A0A450U9W2_9GAMM|nr:MAG: RadC-like JAB domain-containing protein [Candidatus Kentron sp. H]VFJ88893.1 MAG: RadC-like JAB domain-containing protein [Candidatus Kentron sp. H]VFJ95130.1 MAG: RadC-like JAB domain-containing protein [Candidatus Kentron sp. H]
MGDYTAVLETTTTTTTRQEIHKPQPLPQPADLFSVMRGVLCQEGEDSRCKEHFWVVGLRPDNRILYVELVNSGNTTATSVNPIKVYRMAVLGKSDRILLVHNYADGKLDPSESDKRTARALMEGGKLLNIAVLDHLIISEDGYYSFLAQELMEDIKVG